MLFLHQCLISIKRYELHWRETLGQQLGLQIEPPCWRYIGGYISDDFFEALLSLLLLVVVVVITVARLKYLLGRYSKQTFLVLFVTYFKVC